MDILSERDRAYHLLRQKLPTVNDYKEFHHLSFHYLNSHNPTTDYAGHPFYYKVRPATSAVAATVVQNYPLLTLSELIQRLEAALAGNDPQALACLADILT